MNTRTVLRRSLLVIGILAAAVVLFFAGDHDDPFPDTQRPTVGGHP